MNTTAERTSDREFVVRRTFNAPARIVFDAWTKPELFKQWWVPKSMGMTLDSCEIDARTGGGYRLVFANEGVVIFEAFGKYVEVTPPSRLVWTNEDEGEDATITTVTFDEQQGKTMLVMSELYPSKEALDEAIASGSKTDTSGETFAQLDALLDSLGASVG